MSTVSRLLVNLDILKEDMEDVLTESKAKSLNYLSAEYLRLLNQYLQTCRVLLGVATDLTEAAFREAVNATGNCPHIVSKRMLSVQVRLLSYVIDYYKAHQKVMQLQETDFSDEADKRLELLMPRAVSAKTKFKTVALAMGRTDYQAFVAGACLPHFDWDWEVLRLDE